MKAVILAAGKGTRMGDLTRELPKPLLKIEGKTLIEWKLDVLPAGCTEVILVIGHLGDRIKEYFGDSYKGIKITYVEAEPKGTGFALFAAKEYLNEPFIVLMGDDLYTREDIAECAKHEFATLVQRSEAPVSGGKIVLDESKEFVQDIVEGSHESGTIIGTALYSLTPEIFEYPLVLAGNGKEEYGLPQTMMQLKGKGIRAVFAHDWYQVTAPEDLKPDQETIKKFM